MFDTFTFTIIITIMVFTAVVVSIGPNLYQQVVRKFKRKSTLTETMEAANVEKERKQAAAERSFRLLLESFSHGVQIDGKVNKVKPLSFVAGSSIKSPGVFVITEGGVSLYNCDSEDYLLYWEIKGLTTKIVDSFRDFITKHKSDFMFFGYKLSFYRTRGFQHIELCIGEAAIVFSDAASYFHYIEDFDDETPESLGGALVEHAIHRLARSVGAIEVCRFGDKTSLWHVNTEIDCEDIEKLVGTTIGYTSATVSQYLEMHNALDDTPTNP